MLREPTLAYIILLALCLLLSSFFSGSEAAFLSLQRLRIRPLVHKRVPLARRVLQLAEHPERLLSTVLLGNTLVNTAAAAVGTAIALTLIQSEKRAVIVATAGVTLLLLVVGEVIPKTIATRHSERVAFLLVRPFRMAEVLLLPVSVLVRIVARGTGKLFGGSTPRPGITEEEIQALILLGRDTGTVERDEAELLAQVFHFGDKQVREVMSSRTRVVWVEKGTTVKQFLAICGEHSAPRFPVYEGSMDHVVGVLSAREVLAAMGRGQVHLDDDATALARPPLFTPETKPVLHLVRELREAGGQMAMVVDEFGGIAGVVTTQQLVDELLGPLTQKRPGMETGFVALGDHTFEVEGGLRIDHANEKLGFDLPDGDYDTVAGFILAHLGHIPREGETLAHNNLTFSVTKMSGVGIRTVKIRRAVPTHPQMMG